ncbi:thioredoxin domain-containing protein [Corynebacterium uropygiale]|uniref:Thioredoxin domain-containing protein n=1 Tax=Corynebacterium uropygiale TaxID=1775911 RepID=A0A9X1QQS2_9CORY|nr:thioredoxin domain-containing protein [Corynebacterium uropygiale]MCF4007406.1 thioredoxin domain-containing protein [Corynebacterium uropygiale]
MSNRVKSPTKGGGAGFIWGILAIVVIAAVVIGYIVVKGSRSEEDLGIDLPGKEQVSFSMTKEDNTIVLRSEAATDASKKIDIYEDFACPHCGELASASDDELKEAIESGKAVVTLHPLTFLDRGDTDGHSHHALAAAWAVADSGDASLYWTYRGMLMENMNRIYKQWDDKHFAQAAKQMGAPEGIVKKIEKGELKEAVNHFSQDNAVKLEKETGQLTSPRIFVDGKEFDLTKLKSLDGWLDKALQ